MRHTNNAVILSKRSAPKDLAAEGRILRHRRKDSSTRLWLAQNDNIFACRSNSNFSFSYLVQSRTTFPDMPEFMAAKPFSNSV